MSYNKPELISVGGSVQVIQGSSNILTKGVQSFPDLRNPQTEFDATMGAYEADE